MKEKEKENKIIQYNGIKDNIKFEKLKLNHLLSDILREDIIQYLVDKNIKVAHYMDKISIKENIENNNIKSIDISLPYLKDRFNILISLKDDIHKEYIGDLNYTDFEGFLHKILVNTPLSMEYDYEYRFEFTFD